MRLLATALLAFITTPAFAGGLPPESEAQIGIFVSLDPSGVSDTFVPPTGTYAIVIDRVEPDGRVKWLGEQIIGDRLQLSGNLSSTDAARGFLADVSMSRAVCSAYSKEPLK